MKPQLHTVFLKALSQTNDSIYQGDDLSNLSPEDIRVVGAMGDSLAVNLLFHKFNFFQIKNENIVNFQNILN